MSGFAPGSDSTPQSFIEAMAASQSALHWERFLFLYQPLFERWLRQYPITASDAPDLIQETLLVVLRRLPEFKHNGQTGAFRSWLKQILDYQVSHHFRKTRSRTSSDSIISKLDIADPNSNLDLLWEQEHDREILRRLLQLTRPMVPAKSWEAFYRTTIGGEESLHVASELEMTINAVYIARSRVLALLRRFGRGMIESGEVPTDSE